MGVETEPISETEFPETAKLPPVVGQILTKLFDWFLNTYNKNCVDIYCYIAMLFIACFIMYYLFAHDNFSGIV